VVPKKASPAFRSVYQLTLIVLCLLVVSYLLSRAAGMLRILAVAVFSVWLWEVYRQAKLTPSEVGLSKAKISSGLRWGAACVLIVGVVISLAAAIHPPFFMDTRYNESIQHAVIKSIVFIPLATVLFEEFIFRGLLLALLGRRYSLRHSVIISSLCFGLWHAFSSLGVNAGMSSGVGTLAKLGTMLGVMVVTAAAGVLFCVVRIKSGSLIAPILFHWSINSFALVAAAIVWNMH